MNMAVDYNELLFLTLLILLAADVCFYMKDVSKAFYFYNILFDQPELEILFLCEHFYFRLNYCLSWCLGLL